jgi:hypothetical protein
MVVLPGAQARTGGIAVATELGQLIKAAPAG